MTTLSESIKRHLSEYYLFYVLAYGLVLPAWFNLLSLLLYKHMSLGLSFLLITIGVTLAFAAGGLRHYQPKLKVVHGALLGVGILLQVVSLAKLFGPALSDIGVALPVAISVAVSLWWIVIYFVDLSDLNREKNKLIGGRVLKYFVLCAVLLYAPSLLLNRYYSKQIKAIFPAGSVHLSGGLDYVQIEKIMDETVWKAKGLISLLTVFILILLFYFYRRAKNSV